MDIEASINKLMREYADAKRQMDELATTVNSLGACITDLIGRKPYLKKHLIAGSRRAIVRESMKIAIAHAGSQIELSRMINKSRSSVSAYLYGTRTIPEDVALRMEEITGGKVDAAEINDQVWLKRNKKVKVNASKQK